MDSRLSLTRNRAAPTPLSPLAALLEQLSLRVSAVRLSKRDVRYELHVEHAASQTRWRKAAMVSSEAYADRRHRSRSIARGADPPSAMDNAYDPCAFGVEDL
ncbi:hypothetical protein PHYPSEUDO_011302 [Phytophthora pseudosyringae]|uniref:Uncharacterized protein n=1 Tax=Phytophthora pseudosyringae TaxID=221518 RepID=A0A8T1WAD7_9STRA|nr:hypothetical protein PHYPSEUDO_011302 [Phytophthora pseudosyringae]